MFHLTCKKPFRCYKVLLHQSPSLTTRCTLYQSYKPLKFTLKLKIAPTCFGLRQSSGSLHLSLAKVRFMKIVIKSMSLWSMRWCGSMFHQVSKETFVIVKGFIISIINIVRKNWTYPWWRVCVCVCVSVLCVLYRVRMG